MARRTSQLRDDGIDPDSKSMNNWARALWPRFVAAVEPVRTCSCTRDGRSMESRCYGARVRRWRQWPDQTTRDLLAQRAVQDDNEYTRSAALQALAAKWPDQTTRDLLAQRAVQDKDGDPRSAALQALAEKWPDQTTRDLLAQRAVQDDDSEPRRAALQALAAKWPDQTTRDLLAQRAVQDDNEYTRSAALQALAAKWPDQTTRDLLAQRAVQDDRRIHPQRRAAGVGGEVAGPDHPRPARPARRPG